MILLSFEYTDYHRMLEECSSMADALWVTSLQFGDKSCTCVTITYPQSDQPITLYNL